MKSVMRGWFREFVGAECAREYLGTDDHGDARAWLQARRRLALSGSMALVTALLTTSTPLASRPDPHVPAVLVTEFRTRLVLDETLGCECGAAAPGRRIAPQLQLDARLGIFSNLLLAQNLAR